jgi:hypothetical protein
MLRSSEILSVKALAIALKQEIDLPSELKVQLSTIDRAVQSDPNYINTAIQDCIDLLSSYPHLQAVYQTERNNLQTASNNSRKGLPPNPIDPLTESSQEILNAVRDICLSVGTPPPKPVGFWGKLFGKKSTAN